MRMRLSGDAEGRLERTATLLVYLLFLVPASALKRAVRLFARLAFPLAIAAKYSGVRIVFVWAGGCFSSAFRTSFDMVPPFASRQF